MKYEDDLYEIAEETVEEEVDVEVGNPDVAASRKKVKRPHNYQVRRQLEEMLETRSMRKKVDYFGDLGDE